MFARSFWTTKSCKTKISKLGGAESSECDAVAYKRGNGSQGKVCQLEKLWVEIEEWPSSRAYFNLHIFYHVLIAKQKRESRKNSQNLKIIL